MKINTKYDLNQKVYITELKVWGTVQSIYINSVLKYYVRFFNGYDPKECYFLEEELSLEDGEGIGFKINK